MYLPWAARKMYGYGEYSRGYGYDSEDSGMFDSLRRSQSRTDPPTSKTKATFGGLNWNYSENCSANLTCVSGRSTLMGKLLEGEYKRLEPEEIMRPAVAILKNSGRFTCKKLDKAMQNITNKASKVVDKKGYISAKLMKEVWDYEPIEFTETEGSKVVLTVTAHSSWIYIECFTTDAATFAFKELHLIYYSLAQVKHEKAEKVPIKDGLELCAKTGGPEIGTKFTLKKWNKVIAKCLCSYRNSEMGNHGPTIELIEVAQQFRGHGYGRLLLNGIESYFLKKFENLQKFPFNVCYCSNEHASMWFMRQGFKDLDNMGEELGKTLLSTSAWITLTEAKLTKIRPIYGAQLYVGSGDGKNAFEVLKKGGYECVDIKIMESEKKKRKTSKAKLEKKFWKEFANDDVFYYTFEKNNGGYKLDDVIDVTATKASSWICIRCKTEGAGDFVSTQLNGKGYHLVRINEGIYTNKILSCDGSDKDEIELSIFTGRERGSDITTFTLKNCGEIMAYARCVYVGLDNKRADIKGVFLEAIQAKAIQAKSEKWKNILLENMEKTLKTDFQLGNIPNAYLITDINKLAKEEIDFLHSNGFVEHDKHSLDSYTTRMCKSLSHIGKSSEQKATDADSASSNPPAPKKQKCI